MKTKEEIKKGCGKVFSFFQGYVIIKCGDRNEKNQVFLCNDCEELINKQEDMIRKVKNILDDIEDDLIDKLKDKFCTCGYKVFISPIDTRCESCKFIDSFYEGLKKIIKQEFGELEDDKF